MKRPACPRCSGGLVAAADVGAGVGRCEGCGSFVCTGDARRALTRWLRVDEAVWSGLLAEGRRGPVCPLCPATLRTFALKAVTVDGCGDCGALFLDPGELARLTGVAEPPVPPGTPPPSSPVPGAATTASDDNDGVIAPGSVGRIYADPEVALQRFLGDAPWVQLVQERQLGEALLSVELGNRYTVRTPEGSGGIALSAGSAARLLLAFAGGLLRSQYLCTDARGTPTLWFARSFERLVLSRLEVRLWAPDVEDGALLGTVERSFRIASTRYELKDARGRVFAQLERPLLSLWQFRLRDPAGAEIGGIAKQWSGLATEWLTDGDDFGIDFGAAAWTPAQRAVIVGAALAIDLDHFERRKSDGLLSGLLDA
jgi:hypothetical protein